jgi:hypothetical protein
MNQSAFEDLLAACIAALHRCQEAKRLFVGRFVGDDELIAQLEAAIKKAGGKAGKAGGKNPDRSSLLAAAEELYRDVAKLPGRQADSRVRRQHGKACGKESQMTTPACPRCRRPMVGWPLVRPDLCSPKGWVSCIRNPEAVAAKAGA